VESTTLAASVRAARKRRLEMSKDSTFGVYIEGVYWFNNTRNLELEGLSLADLAEFHFWLGEMLKSAAAEAGA
jgi:hypothetical protein